MPIALQQPVLAGLITADRGELPVRATLRYTSRDPLAVHIDFPADISADGHMVTWTFARDLLADGLGAPAGLGAVHIWPCGQAGTIVELTVGEGVALVHFTTSALRRFLDRTYGLVAPGGEDVSGGLDSGLASLLDGV